MSVYASIMFCVILYNMAGSYNNSIRTLTAAALRSLRFTVLTLVFMIPALILAGCGGGGAAAAQTEPEEDVIGSRDCTPEVLVPEHPGTEVLGNEEAEIDITHIADGYFSAAYHGDSKKVKLQMTADAGLTYTYDLVPDGSWNVFPVSDGNGHYILGIYSNIEATMYAEVYSTELDVTLTDEFIPFLYPNQYVWFTEDTRAVARGAELCRSADTDLDCVTKIYQYVTGNIVYDREEAENVQSGYLPDVDEVMDTGKGICLDYSALMASMLRSQGIPTRMEVGYAGTAYHAWISCYLDEIGWINSLIYFDGENWSMMDPTMAASQGEKKLKKFIGDGTNYRRLYLY